MKTGTRWWHRILLPLLAYAKRLQHFFQETAEQARRRELMDEQRTKYFYMHHRF